MPSSNRPIDTEIGSRHVAEGFRHQRMRLLAVEERQRVQTDPRANALFATRMGHFPRARYHFVERNGGLDSLLLFCVDGCGQINLPKVPSISLHAGEAIWIDCQKPHGYFADFENPWSIFWVHLAGRAVRDWQRRLPAPSPTSKWAVAAPSSTIEHFEKLWRVIQAPITSDSAVLHLSCATQTLVTVATTGLLPAQIGSEAPTDNTAAHGLDAVAQRLGANLRESPTTAEMASWAGYSVSHFQALFRERFGMPPGDYLTGLRLESARALLQSTTLSINAVADRVGYADPLYFSRVFRRRLGLSPRDFRRRATPLPGA